MNKLLDLAVPNCSTWQRTHKAHESGVGFEVQTLPAETEVASPADFKFQELPRRLMRKRAIGRFYALVIGNTQYQQLPPLKTSARDAERIADLLENKYGFATQLLIDADEEAIKRAKEEATLTDVDDAEGLAAWKRG